MATPIIELREVRKTYDGVAALDGLSCSFHDGRITAVIGPSGAGKTTMLRLILGLTSPDAGQVLFRGRAVAQMSNQELLDYRRDFGVLLEGAGALFASMNVFDNVAFPLRRVSHYPEELVRAHVEKRLREVGLWEHARKMPNELSTGMRVRVAFARAVITQPPVLFFDSPDTGMDPVRMTALTRLIGEHHRSHPCTTLLITHDLDAVRAVAQDIILVHRGRVVEQGLAPRVLASEDPFTRQFLAGLMVGPLAME